MSEQEKRQWYGVLAPVGKMSADDRIFDSEMDFSWRDLPDPLKYMPKDLPGHMESETVGAIEGLEVWNNLIVGWGTFSDTARANEVYDLIEDGAVRGVSVDLDMAESQFEDENGNPVDPMEAFFAEMEGDEPVRIIQRVTKARLAAATICAIPAFVEAFVTIGERPENWEDMKVPGSSNFEGAVDNPQEGKEDVVEEEFRDYSEEERKKLADEGKAMPDGSYPIVDEEDLKNAIQAVGRAKDIDAAKAHIKKRAKALDKEDLIPEDWSQEDPVAASAFTMVEPVEAVVAAANALPAQWFKDPGLDGPTPMTITEDGYIYGHAASWDTCHIGKDECVTAPHSYTDYAYFHTGEIITDEGPVAVGQITMRTGHPALSHDARTAAAHYDNTGTAVADIHMGEDKHGIWFAGALRDGLTDEDIRELRAAAISGDWRPMGVGLEMVAALAVNTPGFPIPRLALAASGSKTTAMVATGIIQHHDTALREEMDLKAFAKDIIREVREDDARRERMNNVRAAIRRDNTQRREVILSRLGED